MQAIHNILHASGILALALILMGCVFGSGLFVVGVVDPETRGSKLMAAFYLFAAVALLFGARFSWFLISVWK